MSEREVPIGVDSSSSSNRKRKGARYLVYDLLQGNKFFDGEFGDPVKILAKIRTWDKAIVRDHQLFGRCVVRKFGSSGTQIRQICDLVTNANREVECTPEATRHPNIVDFWGYLQNEEGGNIMTIGLVVEYMSGGSIADYMKENEDFLDNQEICLRITLQIARALAFCHEKLGLLHRNIQPSKILLSSDKRTAKLGNFGYSRRRTKDEQNKNNWTANKGNMKYMAPEVIGNEVAEYGEKADVFSFALCVFAMTHKRYPFENEQTENHLLLRKYLMNDNNRPNIDGNRVHPDLQSIIKEGWTADEDHRPLMNDIVSRLTPLVSCD